LEREANIGMVYLAYREWCLPEVELFLLFLLDFLDTVEVVEELTFLSDAGVRLLDRLLPQSSCDSEGPRNY
jgi:hypothetical protein